MMLNLLVPHGKPLFKEFVLAPMRRCCFLRKAVTQHEMDNLYAGSRWEIDVRYTFIMNTLFVALFFSSGMPILLPLAAASLAVTFFIDKYLRTWKAALKCTQTRRVCLRVSVRSLRSWLT